MYICVCTTCVVAQVCVMSQGITLPVVLSLLCATHCPLSSVLLHLTSFFTRPGKHYCCIALVCCWCCDSCSTHGTFCFELLLCHCCCLHVNLVSVVQFFFWDTSHIASTSKEWHNKGREILQNSNVVGWSIRGVHLISSSLINCHCCHCCGRVVRHTGKFLRKWVQDEPKRVSELLGWF